MTAQFKHDRHAELVSASISRAAAGSLVEKWTLKQVQGDGYFQIPRRVFAEACALLGSMAFATPLAAQTPARGGTQASEAETDE